VDGGVRKGPGVPVNGRAIARRLLRAESGSKDLLSVPLGQMCVPNRAASVPVVRRFVGLVTDAYGVAHVSETARLLVSELGGNVVQHAGDAPGGRFTVVVTRTGNRLRVETHDTSPRIPVHRHVGVLDESGRGLFLVEQLAAASGTDKLPDGGKSIWFEIDAWDQATDDLKNAEGTCG
jgi:anti-sigma regulatory factor (Ser/Thr protein kinase)